jgi:hypothetical protein
MKKTSNDSVTVIGPALYFFSVAGSKVAYQFEDNIEEDGHRPVMTLMPGRDLMFILKRECASQPQVNCMESDEGEVLIRITCLSVNTEMIRDFSIQFN